MKGAMKNSFDECVKVENERFNIGHAVSNTAAFTGNLLVTTRLLSLVEVMRLFQPKRKGTLVCLPCDSIHLKAKF